MLAIGIGGSQTALNEFAKPAPTAFFGTVLISAKRHGYEPALMVYQWVTENKAPPAETLTGGTLMTRKNYAEVRKQMGL
jgi:L-arabinose transport system substrate-binding protein